MIVAMSGKAAGYSLLRRGESGARTTIEAEERERFIGYSFFFLLFLLFDGLQKSDGSDRKRRRRTSKGRGKNRNSGLIGKVGGRAGLAQLYSKLLQMHKNFIFLGETVT